MRMTCSDYLARVSDDLDGRASPETRAAMEAHLKRCARCRRYRDVLVKGAQVLRALPEPSLPDDFGARLQHRIYHMDDFAALERASSGAPTLTVLGMALLLTAIAWAPRMRERPPVVELEPIVVDRPPAEFVARPAPAMPGPLPLRSSMPELERGLFDEPHALLLEYSPLSQRYRRTESRPGDGSPRAR